MGHSAKESKSDIMMEANGGNGWREARGARTPCGAHRESSKSGSMMEASGGEGWKEAGEGQAPMGAE